MTTSRILKWITGGLEAVLGFPVVGGVIVIGFLYTPLALMLALHIITLVFSRKEGYKSTGSVLGIVTSCVAWIPLVGMIMHIITAIFLMQDAAKEGTPINS
jgi:hypothetical protein